MRTVAIVGLSPISRGWAPTDNPTAEIWTLNVGCQVIPRFNRLYELHTRASIDQKIQRRRRPADYWTQLAALRVPVVMQEALPEIPTSVKFPLAAVQAVVKDVDEESGEFFPCSVALMMAHAIVEGVDRIELYGVDVADPGYREQVQGLSHVIGFARGRGIAVQVPVTSRLCKAATIYGYERETRPENHVYVNLDQFTAAAIRAGHGRVAQG